MMKILSLPILLSCCISVAAQGNTASEQTLHITSPGSSHSITVNYEKADSAGRLVYSVDFLGRPLIEKSQMGLDLDNRTWEMALALGQRKLKQPKCWMDNFEVDSVTYNPTVDRTWHPLYGERSTA
jgi:alpha-glucosidase